MPEASQRLAPRIVVSGAVGAGKTTLVHALAERLGVPAIGEGLCDLYAELTANQRLRSGSAPQAERSQALERLMQTFFDWAHERARQYGAHPGFVADRWEADLLDLWLKLFADFDCDARTAQLLGDMRAKAQGLACAVLLPPAIRPVEARNEDGLRRRQTFTLTFLSSLVTSGLLRQCPGLPVLALPAQSSVEERVDRVLAFIGA